MCCLLVASGWVYFLGQALHSTLLDRAYYEYVWHEAGAGSALYRWFGQMAKAHLPAAEAAVEPLIDRAYAEAFDEHWLKARAFVLVDDMIGFLKGKTASLRARIDFRNNKQHYAQLLLASMRELHSGDLEQMGIQPANLESWVGNVVTKLPFPDQFNLAELQEHLPPEPTRALATLRSLAPLVSWAPLVLATLILLGCLALVRLDALRWCGGAVVFAGVTFLLAVNMLEPSLVEQLATELSREPALPVSADMIASIVQRAATSMRNTTLPSMIAGAVLVASGYVLTRPKQSDASGDASPRSPSNNTRSLPPL